MKTLKETCQITGLSEHTIRYYTDLGLVPSLVRSSNNRRLFNEESIEWLNGVKYLRELGMSLEDIKEYETLCMCDHDEALQKRYDIIMKQVEIAKQEVENAKLRLAYVEKKAAKQKQILEHKIPDDKNPRRKKDAQ